MRQFLCRCRIRCSLIRIRSKPRPVGWEQRRLRLDEVGSVWPVADDVRLESVDIGGIPGEFSSAPGADPSGILLYFHGGGYCSGSILSHRRMVTEAGRACGLRTLAIGYRLAPEHPFPAACEDAIAAWNYLRKQGVAAGKIVVGGDSAGGGLTLALLQHLRNAGEDAPRPGRISPCPATPWRARMRSIRSFTRPISKNSRRTIRRQA
jgi:acetyl esterase/lipase